MGLEIGGLGGGRLARAESQAYEQVARELLPADEDLRVRFGLWDGEDDGVPRVVCKVESPPCDPLFDGPQWRWWSPMVASPDELREVLAAAVAARRARSRPARSAPRAIALRAGA